jgi:hypothetical protein
VTTPLINNLLPKAYPARERVETAVRQAFDGSQALDVTIRHIPATGRVGIAVRLQRSAVLGSVLASDSLEDMVRALRDVLK